MLKIEQASKKRGAGDRVKRLKQKIAAQKEMQKQKEASNEPGFTTETLPELKNDSQDQPFGTGTWAQKMNKMLFLQDFKQLVEKHRFECENAEFMENNKFIMDFMNFLKTSGVKFSENPDEKIIEYTQEGEEEVVVESQDGIF